MSPGGIPSGSGARAIEVEVQLFANLADYLPADARGGTVRLAVPEGATLELVLRRLAIPPGLPRLLFVNGRDARPDDPLAAGDVVTVLPPLAGGGRPPRGRAGPRDPRPA